MLSMMPEQLKESLCHDGVWEQDSPTHIAVVMAYHRPARCLYADVPTQRTIRIYVELVHMYCEYADSTGYSWMKGKLKEIVWVDFKGFYDVLAQLIRDNVKKMPFDDHDKELMGELASVWAEVGTFPDYH